MIMAKCFHGPAFPQRRPPTSHKSTLCLVRKTIGTLSPHPFPFPHHSANTAFAFTHTFPCTAINDPLHHLPSPAGGLSALGTGRFVISFPGSRSVCGHGGSSGFARSTKKLLAMVGAKYVSDRSAGWASLRSSLGAVEKKNNFKSVKCEPKEGEEGRTNRHQTPPKTPSPTRPHAPRPATPSTPHPPKTPSRSRPTRPA